MSSSFFRLSFATNLAGFLPACPNVQVLLWNPGPPVRGFGLTRPLYSP